MRILLANDTAIIRHFGCQGVSDAHARMLGAAGHEVVHRVFAKALHHHRGRLDEQLVAGLSRDDDLVRQVDDVDAVVVNGEGTIHHGKGRPWLALLALAQSRGKPTFLVNAVFQESDTFLDTLRRLDDFTVRDGYSLAYAESLGLRARLVADSILAAKFDDAPAEFHGDVVTDGHSQRPDVIEALNAFRAATQASFIKFSGEDAFVAWNTLPARLKEARVMVTGRHHGIYIALKAGIPFVALGSNTFKVEGALMDLGRPDLLAHTLDDILAIRDRAVVERDVFSGLADRLTDGSPLTTFRALGAGGADRAEAEVARMIAQRDARLAALSATA